MVCACFRVVHSHTFLVLSIGGSKPVVDDTFDFNAYINKSKESQQGGLFS
jgi:hypothetical protein